MEERNSDAFHQAYHQTDENAAAKILLWELLLWAKTRNQSCAWIVVGRGVIPCLCSFWRHGCHAIRAIALLTSIKHRSVIMRVQLKKWQLDEKRKSLILDVLDLWQSHLGQKDFAHFFFHLYGILDVCLLDIQSCAFTCSLTAWDQLTDYATCSIDRRSKKNNGIERVSFTFSPSYWVSFCGVLVFWFGWFEFFVVVLWYPGFLQSLHVLFTYKRIIDRQGFMLDRLVRKNKPPFAAFVLSRHISEPFA